MECIVCRDRLGAPELWATRNGLRVLRCPRCGLGVRETLPEPGDLPTIYGGDYFRAANGRDADGYADYLADESLHRDLARRRLRLLERWGGTPGGSLVDVGAAAGYFVDEARRAGWDAVGVDVAETIVAWAAEHHDARVRLGTIHDVPERDVAAVTMWDYLEHSLDPVGDLERAADLAREGGLLALSTGDADSLVARISGRRWHLLTPRHHNFFFTARTLRTLLDRAGFEVNGSSHPGARYSISHVAYKLERTARRGVTTTRLAETLGSSRRASGRAGSRSTCSTS